MAQHSPASVWLQTRVSNRLLSYLLLLHGLSGVAIWLTGLPFVVLIGASVGLGVHLVWQLRVHVFRHGRAGVRVVHWQTDGCWRILDGDGQVHRYEKVTPVIASPMFLLAKLESQTGRRWLLLASDSASPEPLRQLRVRLRQFRPDDGPDQSRSLAGT